MSSSDFNKLLTEKYKAKGKNGYYDTAELYDEYIKLHLPDEKIGGEPTNKLEDGVQLGAIYIVEYDDSDNGYWFVVGYSEQWGLKLFYGVYRGNRITSKGLTVWNGLERFSPNGNNIITDSSIIKRLVKYFIGSNHTAEIFIAYSTQLSKPRTLNFSKRGFL